MRTNRTGPISSRRASRLASSVDGTPPSPSMAASTAPLLISALVVFQSEFLYLQHTRTQKLSWQSEFAFKIISPTPTCRSFSDSEKTLSWLCLDCARLILGIIPPFQVRLLTLELSSLESVSCNRTSSGNSNSSGSMVKTYQAKVSFEGHMHCSGWQICTWETFSFFLMSWKQRRLRKCPTTPPSVRQNEGKKKSVNNRLATCLLQQCRCLPLNPNVDNPNS